MYNYPTDLIKKFYIVVFIRAKLIVYSIMVVVYMLKELKNKNFVFNIAKVAIILTVAFIALSTQASACHVNIGDKVWNDLDKNGVQDWDYANHCFKEPGMANVIVELYKCDDTLLKSTTTNSDGYYKFRRVEKDDYYIKFILPEDYVFSPKDQTDCKWDSDANPTDGKTDCIHLTYDMCTVDAGMYYSPAPKPASVGNYVWEDDGDGIQETGELGIEGVTVELYYCNDTYVNSTSTNSTGFYEFTDLDPGCYYLVFKNPAGYVFSPLNAANDDQDSDANQGNGETETFDLDAGVYYDTVDAGLHKTDQEIPEFPTVAIPMVAIMGLAFVFGRRKE